MRVRSVHDVAAIIRGRRLALGMSQEELARRVGVSRRWIYFFEAGKTRAELAIVLRLADELGLVLDLAEPDPTVPPAAATVDLDAILDRHRAT